MQEAESLKEDPHLARKRVARINKLSGKFEPIRKAIGTILEQARTSSRNPLWKVGHDLEMNPNTVRAAEGAESTSYQSYHVDLLTLWSLFQYYKLSFTKIAPLLDTYLEVNSSSNEPDIELINDDAQAKLTEQLISKSTEPFLQAKRFFDALNEKDQEDILRTIYGKAFELPDEQGLETEAKEKFAEYSKRQIDRMFHKNP